GSTLMGFVSVTPNVWSLFFILAVGGLGSAAFHPAAAAMARDTGAQKSMSISLFAAGGALGSALMPVAVLSVVRGPGAGYVPLLSTVGVVIGLALFVLTPRQVQPVRVAGTRQPLFDLSLLAGPVGLLALAGTLRAMAFISFINGMPLFLASVRGFAPDAQVIGLTLSIFSGAAALGTILAGLAAPRIGRTRLIVGSMLLALPMLLLVLRLPSGGLAYFVLVALAGMLTNASIPLLVVSAQDLAPDAVAAASGLLMGFTWGVAGVVYIGFGALQQFIGIAPAVALGFLFLVPAAILVGSILRRNAALLSTD
ncbi:MAG TPA: MFS transporter, partial [Trueperaceae bacterium]|nr:MFS transporter [Trueperaceae bacterium]